jgi:hypothetical protein
MSAQQIFRLRNPALLMALAAAFPVISYAAGAANVDFAAGSVTAVNAVGVQRPLSKGAEIGNGDTIRTGDGGRAQVRFSDGAMVSLQPKTEFRIDNYQFSGKADESDKGFFSLLKGGLRTITGLVGRSSRENYRVSTSVATIGIRGTEYTAGLNPSGDELNVATEEGLVEVCNDAGCVLLASGESGLVQGSGQPRRYSSRPRLPPASIPEDLQPVFSSSDQRPDPSPPPPPPPPSLLTGTQTYATVYANVQKNSFADSNIGVGTGTINAAGVLTSFTSAEGMAGANVAAGNTVQNSGNDGVVAWGKWISTAPAFTGLSSGGEGGVLHYVTGIPTTDSQVSLGSTGSYTLLGGGVSGSNTGAGSITSASMSVDFIGAKVTSLAVGMNVSGSYNLSASNLPITGFGTAPVFSTGSASVTGGTCSGVCSASVSGAFFGAGAARAGVSFNFSDGQDIAGAVALKK